MKSDHTTQHNSHRLHHKLIIPVPSSFFKSERRGNGSIVLRSDGSGGVEVTLNTAFCVSDRTGGPAGRSRSAGASSAGNQNRKEIEK